MISLNFPDALGIGLEEEASTNSERCRKAERFTQTGVRAARHTHRLREGGRGRRGAKAKPHKSQEHYRTNISCVLEDTDSGLALQLAGLIAGLAPRHRSPTSRPLG